MGPAKDVAGLLGGNTCRADLEWRIPGDAEKLAVVPTSAEFRVTA